MFSLWLSQLMDKLILLGIAVWLQNALRRSSEDCNRSLEDLGIGLLYLAIMSQFIPAIQHLIEYWPY